uniref:TraB domain-containing protein n=1 Tax=Tetradesmus obliquus TaxID=3088 RepID=A0A383VMJ9_TETOB|eukprot:jgi/Sobl393_1/14573/SZX65924.1
MLAGAATQQQQQQQQQVLDVPLPPQGYDYKAENLDETVDVVSQQYPQLMDLVEQGNLVVYRRPASYRERRVDGYREPELVFMLGTAHVSQASAAEVSRVVEAVQPQCVVVELCKSRVGVLQLPEQQQQLEQLQVERWQQQQQQEQQAQVQLGLAAAASSDSAVNSSEEDLQAAAATALQPSSSNDSISSSSSKLSQWQLQRAFNPMSLSGSSFVGAVTRSAQLGGQSGLLLRLLIAGGARKAADQLGVLPGAEFRAAARAADAAGASLVLGDRPIEITLERAWNALPWQRRLRLLGDLLLASLAPKAEELTAEDVERFRSDDTISQFFDQLSSSYPELIAPLIAERDLYLAWSMKRSKAVNGSRAVVGVVGKGHLRGLVYALKHDQGSLRFADLVGGKNRKKSKAEAAAALGRRVLVEVAVGAGLYAAWLAVTQPEAISSLLPH